MPETPPVLESDDPTDVPPGTPRWVKLFAVIAIVLALVFIIAHLTGGGLRNHMGQ